MIDLTGYDLCSVWVEGETWAVGTMKQCEAFAEKHFNETTYQINYLDENYFEDDDG